MIGAFAVFSVAFAYFFCFRSYGLQVEDEGTLLFQLARAASGQLPYVDFHTGYTPGFFHLGSLLLDAVGWSTENVRVVLAVVNALAAAALYVLARTTVGGWLAVLPPLAWVTFIPAYAADFAAFNVPYPAWFATLAWMAVGLALVAWNRRRTAWWLAAAGLAASCAFAVKPNAGAFALAAAVWVVAMTARQATAGQRATAGLASAVMALGVWLAFGFAWYTVDAAIHLAPLVVLLALVIGPLAGRFATGGGPQVTGALAALGAGFVPLTAAWMLPVLARLGVADFFREVLFIGSDAAAVYYLEHPPPEPYAIAVVGGATGIAVLGRLIGGGRMRPVAAAVVLATAVVAVIAYIVRNATMPETAAQSVLLQLENAGFWLAPLAHWGALALLARAGLRREAARPAETALVVVLPLAIAMYWQLYPRTDFMHLAISVPLTVVVATALLDRVLDWWRAGAWPARLPAAAVSAALMLVVTSVVALKVVPLLASVGACGDGAPVVVDLPRVRACMEPAAADDLRAFDETARYLARYTRQREAVLAFPALAGVLFAAERTSPVPHDYWYPGFPSHGEERRMRERLEREPPRFVVTLNTGWTFFTGSAPYFLEVRELVTSRYRLRARFGRFDVLVRDDWAERVERRITKVPPGPAAAALDPVLGRRRQAARRWMAGLTVAEAAGARLDSDRRAAILRLRALRDGGDLRAAGWLIAGYRHDHPRVRNDAASAMEQVTKRFTAARYRWADDFDAATYRPYVAPYRDEVKALQIGPDPRVRAFAEAVLFVLDRPVRGSAAR